MINEEGGITNLKEVIWDLVSLFWELSCYNNRSVVRTYNVHIVQRFPKCFMPSDN